MSNGNGPLPTQPGGYGSEKPPLEPPDLPNVPPPPSDLKNQEPNVTNPYTKETPPGQEAESFKGTANVLPQDASLQKGENFEVPVPNEPSTAEPINQPETNLPKETSELPPEALTNLRNAVEALKGPVEKLTEAIDNLNNSLQK